jgi:hypothetical protein
MYLKLESAGRVSGGSPYDFTLQLTNRLNGRYRLKSIFINNSYYNVNSTNNKIYFFENGSAKTATVTPGFYNSTNICAAIDAAMTSASGGFAAFASSFSAISALITIASTQSFSMKMATNTDSSIGPSIGFTTDTATSTSITGSSIINLQSTLAFNIVINDQHNISDLTGNCASTFIVPVQANSLTYVVYEPTANFEQAFVVESANQLKVKVYDDRNQPVPLSTEWFMILQHCPELF